MTRQNRKLPKGLVKRGDTYHADFHAKGQRICKSLSRDLKVATELLAELRVRSNRGEFGLLDNDFSVEELKEQYLRHCRQTNKAGTVQRYELNLAAILPQMPKRVSLVTVEQIWGYRDRRLAEGISPRTINMDVDALSRMFRWGKVCWTYLEW